VEQGELCLSRNGIVLTTAALDATFRDD